MLPYREEIRAYVAAHRSEILEMLKELVRIPSVRGDASDGAPFGADCARVLHRVESLYSKFGIETELNSDGGYLLSYLGEGERTLGIFSHADVVPTGEGWTLTEPFEPKEIDGFLVGRGVMDDKAAVIASLFVARMIKELDIPLSSKLVLFTGSAEERGMGDIKNYLKTHTPPDFALVPDTCFPLYRGNKGRLLIRFYRSRGITGLKAISGGKSGTNVGEAVAKLDFDEALFSSIKKNEDDQISVNAENGEIMITAKGLPKHTALPEGSINAASLIFDLLLRCDLVPMEEGALLEFLKDVTSDYYGKCIGIDKVDPDFGNLTFVNYTVNIGDDSSELFFNVRFGASVDIKETKQKIIDNFSQFGFVTEFLDESVPHIVPKDHPMLLSLMSTFAEFTGKTDGKMYVNAGGTYAQFLPCAAEIGVTTKGGRPEGMPSGHGAVHQPDECISIEGFLKAIELTAHMILECDKELNK